MPLSKIDLERLIAATRRRVEEAQLVCRESVNDAIDDLRTAVLTDTVTVDETMATASRSHSVAISASQSPKDKITPILQAKNLSATMAAKRAGVDKGQFSRWRNGIEPAPMAKALKLQAITKSDVYPNGIEPTKEFWPAGVREK